MTKHVKHIITTCSICLTTLLYTSNLLAGSIKLTWDAPSTNIDDTPLTDLAGYKIYYGTESNFYSDSLNVGNITSYRVKQLGNGTTYYFNVTAYDHSGNESQLSNEISQLISNSGKNPKPPKRLSYSMSIQ